MIYAIDKRDRQSQTIAAYDCLPPRTHTQAIEPPSHQRPELSGNRLQMAASNQLYNEIGTTSSISEVACWMPTNMTGGQRHKASA